MAARRRTWSTGATSFIMLLSDHSMTLPAAVAAARHCLRWRTCSWRWCVGRSSRAVKRQA